MKNTLTIIQFLTDSHVKNVTLHEIGLAETKIYEWQRHVMRGVQQSKARCAALDELENSDALWIRDFAQKYNPTKVHKLFLNFFATYIKALAIWNILQYKILIRSRNFKILRLLSQCKNTLQRGELRLRVKSLL